MQSSLHVAIIMDGNGRWARARGLPRVAGHRAGADAVRRVVESAPGLGIGALTLYSFSSDNWQRPAAEVKVLMSLFQSYLRMETSRDEFSRLMGDAPDVDLLIRTGGEQRLSDFLLWECAYAELLFTPRMWPEFGRADLEAALAEYYSRERRFGRIPEAVAG